MKLVGSAGSPYVRKVRIVLAEKHVAYDYVIDRPSNPGSRVAEFNPLGKIPVLVRDDGSTVYDSPVIVEYIDGVGVGARLIPEAFEARIEVRRWEALGDGIADATVLVSHDYRKPPERRETDAWYDKQRAKIQRGLAAMEAALGARPFCHGTSFGLADIAAGYALGYLDFALPEYVWRTSHPNLVRLAGELDKRESFRTTLHSA